MDDRTRDPDEPDEPDFLDVMDSWDEIDPYEDEEKFVPFFTGDKVKIIAAFVAVALAAPLVYVGARFLVRLLGF